jgi:NAD(P)-dependent dehydrogenase (short-subunit alcohol dehydrogenase family)
VHPLEEEPVEGSQEAMGALEVGHVAAVGEDGVAATVASASGTEAGDGAKLDASDTVTERFTRPEEVADLIVLLASDRAGNVTGSDFDIDGGLITIL